MNDTEPKVRFFGQTDEQSQILSDMRENLYKYLDTLGGDVMKCGKAVLGWYEFLDGLKTGVIPYVDDMGIKSGDSVEYYLKSVLIGYGFRKGLEDNSEDNKKDND